MPTRACTCQHGAVDRYHGVPPYAETQRYVQNVLARCREAA